MNIGWNVTTAAEVDIHITIAVKIAALVWSQKTTSFATTAMAVGVGMMKTDQRLSKLFAGLYRRTFKGGRELTLDGNEAPIALAMLTRAQELNLLDRSERRVLQYTIIKFTPTDKGMKYLQEEKV